MIILFVLLSSISLLVASQGSKTAADCTIGSKWTDTYVRSECYQGTGVRGVRAIGCVPTNDQNGAMINPGANFDDKYFTYSCSKSGEIVSYKIINCRDSTGKNLAVNENRTMADGSKFRCYKDKAGAIKLAQDTPDGCLYDGVKYAVGKTWTEPAEFKETIAGAIKLIGKAVRMECKKEGAGYISFVAACITPSGKTLYSGRFVTENKINIKCLIASNGTVTMRAVDDKDLTCKMNGVEVKNGEQYTTPDGIDVYICIFKIMKKISCIIDGKPYGADTLVTIKNKKFYCNKAQGYVNFGNLTGCTLPDGSIKPFYSSWVVGTEVHRCYFKIEGKVVTAYVEFWRCSYNGVEISINKVVTDGKKSFKKCEPFGKGNKIGIGMRDLTAAEITAYINERKQRGSSKEFSGFEGEAGGETIAQDPSGSANSTIETPVSINPADDCKDLLTVCPSLAPLCTSPPTSEISTTMSPIFNINEIAKKTKVTIKQIQVAFKFMGFDKVDGSNECENEDINQVVRGLIESDSNTGPSCKKTDIFKRRVHRLVDMACPETCQSCNADFVGKLQSKIEKLVRFYTSDCQ